MTSNVAFERSFAELSNAHEYSMVSALSLAEISETSCSVFSCATVIMFLKPSSFTILSRKVGGGKKSKKKKKKHGPCKESRKKFLLNFTSLDKKDPT